MTGVKVGKNVPVRIFRVMNDHFENGVRFIMVFLRDEEVVFVLDRFAELTAMRLLDANIPMWVHGT